jgi:hypothetical protein
MVLENSSDSTGGDIFDENPPASDNDPYSSSTPQAGVQNYKISGLKLPQPIPIIGPLTGFNQELFMKVLQARIQTHAQILKRPPNQEEVEATAYWVAKQISVYSYGTPVGVLGGLWRANSTQATFRFPFWQPNLEKFNSQIFPHERMTLLRGNRAVQMWHLLRWSLYGAVGKSIGQVIFGSYSMTVATVGELGDPRLKAMTEAARQQAVQKRGGLPGSNMPGSVGSSQSGGNGEGNTPDDASPTGGMFQEESNDFGKDTYKTKSDPQRREQPRSPRSPPTRWPQQPQQAPVPTQQAGTQDDPFYTFDDASPTGGADAGADTPAQQPQRQQRSAWDRVRQTAGRGPARPADSGQAQEQSRGWAGVREQAQSPTASDDYAFSKGDEERNLARSEAQKEFDARVERERGGGDFSTGSEDQKRW